MLERRSGGLLFQSPCSGRVSYNILSKTTSKRLLIRPKNVHSLQPLLFSYLLFDNLCGQTVPVLSHSHSQKIFPDARVEPPMFQYIYLFQVHIFIPYCGICMLCFCHSISICNYYLPGLVRMFWSLFRQRMYNVYIMYNTSYHE